MVSVNDLLNGLLSALGVQSTTSTTARTSSSTTKALTTSTTSVKTTTSSTTTTSIKTTSSTITTASVASTTSKSSTLSSSSSTSLSSSILSSILSSSTSSTSSTSSVVTTVKSTSSSTNGTVSSNSTLSSNSTASSNGTLAVALNGNVASTILIIARNAAEASSSTSGFNAYGIPFYTLIVPQSGVNLPTLYTSSGGNYGGIVIASGVQYDFGSPTGWQSALTNDQWNSLYAYQVAYGVRMVQYDVFPSQQYGVSSSGSCCDSGVEQLLTFTNTAAFTQAGLVSGAGISTIGLYHNPAVIVNTSTTVEIAQFGPSGNFTTNTTAAVINNFDTGRQQMVFFISWATDWSATSNYLQHAYITWMTRGLYAGIRRVNLNTQIDDVMLPTAIYTGNGSTYRISTDDITGIKDWSPKLQAKMNSGSYFRVELGYNGNGNIIYSQAVSDNAYTTCNPNSIDTGEHNATALEFQKPLGTGSNVWPNMTTWPWSNACLNLDPLKNWFATTSNRDAFMHITHTFSHYELNNSTYSDALKEIQFNQNWLQKVGISAGAFTADGLIPPAITGLHNGDVLRAWHDAGLTNAVGDNTRPPLRNQQNVMYPYITTSAANGYDGFTIVPRWATRIYYNCDSPACTTQEWIDTSAGKGTFSDLLAVEKSDTMRHLFGLYHEGYMFHQANLRNTGLDSITINGVTSNYSIMQAWTETIVQEFVRLVNWPMITLKQTDLATSFINRMTRDACNYQLTWTNVNGKISGVTVSASGNTCSVPIPVTVPGPVTSTQGFTTEQVGNDPLTIWVQLSGQPVTFTLSTPVAW